MIAEYTRRRNDLRDKYPSWSKNPEYAKKAKKLTAKIKHWKRQAREVEKHLARAREVDKLICEFFSIKAFRKKNQKQSDERVVLARMFFYKYSMDNGTEGRILSDYMGSYSYTPAKNRKDLLGLFQKESGVYSKWQEFKAWMKTTGKDKIYDHKKRVFNEQQ